jgi:mRNA interferase MazF
MDLVMARKSKKPERFDVYLVNLDPTVGAEIQKTRPCVIISPNEINRHLKTVIVAPMTSTVRQYPSRVAVQFRGQQGEIALEQIRTIDTERLVKRWGALESQTTEEICRVLLEMFAL